jgi:hypothetical protein
MILLEIPGGDPVRKNFADEVDTVDDELLVPEHDKVFGMSFKLKASRGPQAP